MNNDEPIEVTINGPAEEIATPSGTSIWEELDGWGESLPDWQRFIVSYAVRDGILTEGKIHEAYKLFLRGNQLDQTKEPLPKIPASVTGRAVPSEMSPVVLQEMRALQNANAMPNTSNLTFGPGLTVVHGHNAAGKSGFSRMLSSACFSRSKPKIIRNIHDDSGHDSPATAEFVINNGNDASEIIAFSMGDEHADLQRVSVFDSSAARIHLAEENELGFQPAGFDVFDELIRTVNLISQKLDADIMARTNPNKFDQLFTDPGSVAEYIAGLSAKSNVAELRVLDAFDQAEQDRLDEVVRQEKDLLIKSPVETLRVLATVKTGISVLEKKMREITSQLGDAASTKAHGLLDALRKTTAAAIKAGAETVSNPKLTKTGSDDWDIFVEASRALGQAESEIYPDEGDPCLLCHRPLDAPSVTLIRRMWGYLE